MSIALKTNEWNSLKVQFRELVRDESLRGELEKFFDDEIRRRFGMAISGAVEAAEIEESRSVREESPMQRILIATLMAFFFGLFSMPVSQSAPANGLGRWLGGQGDLAAKYDLLSATPVSSLLSLPSLSSLSLLFGLRTSLAMDPTTCSRVCSP